MRKRGQEPFMDNPVLWLVAFGHKRLLTPFSPHELAEKGLTDESHSHLHSGGRHLRGRGARSCGPAAATAAGRDQTTDANWRHRLADDRRRGQVPAGGDRQGRR